MDGTSLFGGQETRLPTESFTYDRWTGLERVSKERNGSVIELSAGLSALESDIVFSFHAAGRVKQGGI